MAGLTTDPRMVWWLQRAVIAGTVGTVVGLTVDWRLGLTLAAVVASIDAIYRSRITAVIPAAARVSSAQRRTRWRLGRLGSAGYYSLHARRIPGTGQVVEHLVIGSTGVYALDSEHWDRRLPVRATQGGRLFHGPFDQSERLGHAREVAAAASGLIGQAIGQVLTVRPAMVIYGPTIPWIVVTIDGVDIFAGRRLRRYLKRAASTPYRGRHLEDWQIELIHEAASQALPPLR
jgi:hypothetical protein